MGTGLFTRAPFQRKDRVADFSGELVSPDEYGRRERAGRGGYAVRCSATLFLDCYDHAQQGQCLASHALSPRNLWSLRDGRAPTANTRLLIGYPAHLGGLPRVSLVATRTIPAHAEILCDFPAPFLSPISSPTAQPPPLSAPPSPPRPSTPPPPASPLQRARTPPSNCTTPAPPSHTTVTPLSNTASASPPNAMPPGVASFRERQRVDRMQILRDDSALSPADQRLISEATARAIECASLVSPSAHILPDQVRAFLTEAHKIACENYGADAAITWAGDFVFDADLLRRDTAQFLAARCHLPTLARSRQLAQSGERLSVERIHATFGPDGHTSTSLSLLDFNRLLDLAVHGVRIFTAPTFSPCPEPAPLRTRYIQVQRAIHKLFHKQMCDGTVVVLPLHLAATIPGIHLQNAQHWTTKKNKPQGRAIADVSNIADPLLHHPLNGATPQDRLAVTSACESAYGTIQHPTLCDLALMVLLTADQHGWDDLMLWKMDLQGAFNLLWINPDHTPLLAFLLVGGLVVLHLVGLFGWAGMPHAFHVLTRALDALIATRISGRSNFYVDDLMACSARHALLQDQRVARETISSLAGPNALAPDKDETGRRLDFIGWQLCLDTRTVTVSHRNLLRTCHAFFCFDLHDRLPRVLLQRMSSLAIRLSELCPVMRPYTSHLSADAHGFSSAKPGVRHSTSPDTRCEIAMWRAFLILLRTEAVRVVRPLHSFRPTPPTVRIEYDASLTGLAAGVSVYCHHSSQFLLLAYTATPVPFDAGTDSSYQNTCEFLAVLLGLLLAHQHGLRDFRYHLLGDSRASLAWASTGRTPSLRARRANVTFSLLTLHLDCSLALTTHVPGVENIIYDGLSRDTSPILLGLDTTLHSHLATPLEDLLTLCNPNLPISSPEDHLSLSASVLSALRTPL